MYGRREMLSYTKTAVTRNAGEKKINSLLDFVSASTDMRLLQARPLWEASACLTPHLPAGGAPSSRHD